MKIGDKVDVLETMCEHYSSPKVIWSAGWTLELISGDWVLVMKELHSTLPKKGCTTEGRKRLPSTV